MLSIPTFFSRLTRSSRLLLAFSGLLFLGFLPFMAVQNGLDNPVPVAGFVNDTFPSSTPGQGSGAWVTVNAFPNLTFSDMIHLEGEPSTNRIVVAEHDGTLYAFDNNSTTSTTSTFLDLTSQTYTSGESGLLGFTFHPRYGIDSNYVYVYYQRDAGSGDWYSCLSRFTVPTIPGPADPSSELVLMYLYDRQDNHNGGGLFFDNDGYLYLSNGDEGGGNNQYGHGQDLDDRLFGGVFRIDVDRNPTTSHPILRQPVQLNGSDISYTANYYIPNSNPFQDPTGGTLEEYYAMGLRNPHRMTYDSATDKIWLGDVGQTKREEVNLVVAGANFQWPYKEGTNNGPTNQPGTVIGTQYAPVVEYPHGQGISIIGGYVYRGPTHQDIQGHYLYADFGSRKLWAMNPTDSSTQELMTLGFTLSAFGMDNNNELYILQYSNNGKIYKLDRQNPGAPEPPQLLSQTGVFSNLNPLTPEDFLIPYELNAPFWSDGAIKTRWMVIPNNGTHNSAAEQIQYSENGNWIFPEGTVLIKHFELPIDETNLSITKKLETRFLIHGSDGNYYGMTYRWNDAQTEAYLLPDSHTDTISIATASGNRTVAWNYPGRGQCLSCHNTSSEGALGPITRQLNGDAYYPVTGRTANQLATLTHLNIFDSSPDTTPVGLGILMTSAAPDDLSASLEDRARSYLDANCASCHQPNTGVNADFDARMSTSLDNQDLIYGNVQLDLGIHDARILIPGQVDRSVLMERLNSVHTDIAMPQLAKNLIDTAGVNLIADWVNSMSPDFGSGSMGQTITFPTLSQKEVGDPAFTLAASSSSGLPITYSVTSGPATISGNTVTLTGADGRVTIRATQNGNGSYDAAPEVERSFWVVPTGLAAGTGLLSTYYNNLDLTNVATTGTDTTIDFYWGSGRPHASMNYETFSVVWEGEIELPYSETFTFTTSTDDGVRLWVNNQLIIDQWNDQAVTEFTGTTTVSAWQRVAIRMEYYQQDVYASAKLEWSSPSLAREVIPKAFLYPVVGQPLSADEIELSAIREGNAIALNWVSSSTDPTLAFEIERSQDGLNFERIKQVEADETYRANLQYATTDEQAHIGKNYYRIKQVFSDGREQVSNIAEAIFQPALEMTVYPNPITTGQSLQLMFHWPYENQGFEIEVLSLHGQKVFQQSYRDIRPSELQRIEMSTAGWSKGVYLLLVTGDRTGLPLGNSKIIVRD